MAYKTPGVYIEEISKFPPSVAEVETAVPAFIGYTQKAERKGADLTNVPTKITSLLEYQQLFGGEQPITEVEVEVDPNNNYAVTNVTVETRFYMYEALRMFFDNGGGKCYIVSVGNYEGDIESGDESTGDPGLRVGLKALEKYDEPTIILFPDGVALTSAESYTLQQLALAQAAKLQDRVALLDLRERAQDWSEARDEFRDAIGINNLKYGAAYTPWLRNAYPREVDFPVFSGNVVDSADNAVRLDTITSDPEQNGLVVAADNAWADLTTIDTALETLAGTSATLKDRYQVLKNAVSAAANDADRETAFQAVLGLVRSTATGLAGWQASLTGAALKRDLDAYGKTTLRTAIEKIVGIEKNAGVLVFSDLADAAAVNTAYAALDATKWLTDSNNDNKAIDEIAASTTDFTAGGTNSTAATLKAVLAELDKHVIGAQSILAFISQIQSAAKTHTGLAQSTLYQRHSIIGNMVDAVKRELAVVPPSGAVAGVYATVDRTRGVWKAPANVSLQGVAEPIEPIDFFDQEDLNVDVVGGKSINAIRAFTGLGILVWGARTLAGNDNEWRYVPVRRFFNMVEESVKKSTSWAVFEPNEANLWTKVKSMIDNYLIQKWREGALAGATPDQAFYVRVGLGQTMTAQDILEGKLIIEIGMAVVRPAEFIVLKFSHKMQES